MGKQEVKIRPTAARVEWGGFADERIKIKMKYFHLEIEGRVC